ncbi:RHS repeat-associated core domain-containing protein, partial [Ralstonia solanacearum]
SGGNVPTGATRYVYDEAGHLLGEYDQSGNAIQETVYLGDTPVVTIKSGTGYYVYADQIDTPRVITDTNNLMVWRWDQTDPFGATLPDENPTGLGVFTYNLRFPGQVYDAETGKHYNANRDYDPASGRYVQSDPIGLNGGQWSTYAYVGGNPTRYTDASGLCPWCVVWGLIELGLIANEIATADVPMIGGGLGGAVARSTTRMAGQIGRDGEAAVRASCDIGSKETLTINGRTRIPDGLIPGVSLSEVKNVSRQSATQQIRDYVAYAEANGLRVDLYTRTDTRLSGPMQQMISDGRINLLPILPKR